MKNILLLIAFATFQTAFLCGQTNSGSAVTLKKNIVDTIASNALISLDTAVVSFNATFINGGIVFFSRTITGNSIPVGIWGIKLKSGRIIIIDEIIFRNREGALIKLPARKYVIR